MTRGVDYVIFAVLAILLVWLLFITVKGKDNELNVNVMSSPSPTVTVLPTESPAFASKVPLASGSPTTGGNTTNNIYITNPSPSANARSSTSPMPSASALYP